FTTIYLHFHRVALLLIYYSPFIISDVERGNEENLSRSIQWQAILLSMFSGFTTKNAVKGKRCKKLLHLIYTYFLILLILI
ncbi:hypothetical protein, partial [Acinetobacter baumannii]|uniref:hypothetical protein n=1 Tax=Acinetobacter baumannii TaxID=470 RepID=UPI001C096E91